MKRFIQRFEKQIIGVLSGFDRLVLRGSLRRIAYLTGMRDFLWHNSVLWKDFGEYAQQTTERLKSAAHEIAEKQNREFIYLPSSKTNKEEVALELAANSNINEGLIGILSCVELCKAYTVRRNKEQKKLELRAGERKCLYLYFYMIDSEFGFMNARIQTWFPFNIQICLNGREWLSRQMDRNGLKYQREDNCFPWVADVKKAQDLMNRQLKTNWPKKLDKIAGLLNPIHNEIFKNYPLRYYWTIFEAEWATDVMFDQVSTLRQIYPGLTSHAMTLFSSPDVMKFLGRKLQSTFSGEIISSFKNRPEGIRVRHWLDENSIKLYDKGSILRVETTINNPFRFRVFRPKENHPEELAWQRLRKGIADMYGWSERSQASNERYLNALAPADTSTPIGKLINKISTHTFWKGKRVRALRPWDQSDLQLFQAVNRGEFSINGFRNRDLQNLLFTSEPKTKKEINRRRSRISRLLRILRAHHLIQKVSRSYRYVLSPKGHQILTAILTTQKLTIDQLNKAIA